MYWLCIHIYQLVSMFWGKKVYNKYQNLKNIETLCPRSFAQGSGLYSREIERAKIASNI